METNKIRQIGRHENSILVDKIPTIPNLVAYRRAKEYTPAARLLGHQNVNFWEVYAEIAQDLDNIIPQNP